MKAYLWIGFFGSLGAVSRMLLSFLVSPLQGAGIFPWWTWVCNIAGCFLLGLFTSDERPTVWSTRWATGFAGSFTTFSAFSVEALVLLETGHVVVWFIYSASSFIAGWSVLVLARLCRQSHRRGPGS